MRTNLSSYQDGMNELAAKRLAAEQTSNRAVSIFILIAVVVILGVFVANHFGLVNLS